MKKDFKKIILRGKTVVFIDWANVHGWKKSLKSEVDISVLYRYLKSYKDIKRGLFKVQIKNLIDI